MKKLLVNTPSGRQELIEVGEGGGYFDASRVLWDERIDGPLPKDVQVGGMYRVGKTLFLDEQMLAADRAAGEGEASPVSIDQQLAAIRKAVIEGDKSDLIAIAQAIEAREKP